MKLPISTILVLLPLISATAEEKLSFNRDVRPILSNKCFFCHGPDKNKRKADLRLDVREDALQEEAFVPGKKKESELYWRITETDPDEIMPPPDSHKELTPQEIEILTRWIEEGAEYEEHWSWITPVRPEVPEEGPGAIDYLVDRRLEKNGMSRSPRAGETTLARRLSFDLIGLPPGREDLRVMESEGVEAYVDHLLQSPHFGERMAIEWLDAVRYADTVGYHGDQVREASAFRDYVIRSFNEDKPFDRFTIEQLAGDLLPESGLWEHVAASYNRLNQISAEGGIQDAEYIAKYQAERVRTTSTAWLGTTLSCAECHDHKFDPFLTKDFYQFAAFFSDILEKGAYTGDGAYQEDTKPYEGKGIRFEKFGPELEVPSGKQEAEEEELTQQLEKAKEEYDKTTPELVVATKEWASGKRAEQEGNKPFDYAYLSEKGERNGIETKTWKFVSAKDGKVYEGSFARIQEGKGTVQHIANGTKKPVTLAEGDSFFTYVWLDPDKTPKQVMLQFHHKDTTWSHRAWWGADEISFGKGADNPAHRFKGDLPETGKWVRLEVPIADVGLKAGDVITQFAFTQQDGKAYWDASGIRTANEAYRFADLPAPVRKLVKKDAAQWSESETAEAVRHYRSIAPETKPARDRVAKLENDLKKLESEFRTVPMTISATAREVRVLPRGNWMDKTGEAVLPATPHFLPARRESTADKRLTRLELAQWIVDRENPLAARTFVNRLWARFFGEGFSGILNDLGSQGEWPTHPELLDWLSVEFMESGWDVKHLIKTIVLSETYLQTSDTTKEHAGKDPYNRLLAHQSAIRLPAELIRDNALAVSGLLNPAIGGESAKPYQPAGYYQHLNFPRREYEADKDDNQYRRGVYTHWQRTFLHPMMKAFDAPSRDECTMEREHSSTPLQALTLLNDPTYVEAARVLAESTGSTEEAFERVLSRPPGKDERKILIQVYEAEKARLAAEKSAADGILSVGLKNPEEENRTEIAARTAVTRVILNLHETITRY